MKRCATHPRRSWSGKYHSFALIEVPHRQCLASAGGGEAEDRIIISADTDFGTLLAIRSKHKPSVILFRRISGHALDAQMRLLAEHLGELEEDLSTGSVVVIEEVGIRIRTLPINASGEQSKI